MPKKSRPEMHLVLSDQHIPFQDPDVEALSLDFIKFHKPDTIHLLGDIMDFYSLSRFDKDPSKILCLQDDIDATVEYFERLRSITNVPIIYSQGNHEARYQRFLWSRAAELSNLQNMRFESLVKLDQFKIKWVTDRNPYKVGKLLFTHGDLVRKWSGATARGHYEKYGCSVIHGHTHRMGAFYHSTMSGTYGAWENGCLCSLKPEYMIGPDWQNGWSVVWFSGAYFHVEQVVIANKQYVYHGSMVKIA